MPNRNPARRTLDWAAQCQLRDEAELRGGIASDSILSWDIEPGGRYLVLCRVSHSQQDRNGNLAGQVLKLPQAIRAAGGIVIDVLTATRSGYSGEWLGVLREAGEIARRHGATVVAATTDRLIRSEHFHSQRHPNRLARARDIDLQAMRKALGADVPVMTFLDPDAHPDRSRALLSGWGQEAKGRPGGRPRKVDRARWRPRVLDLHAQGLNHCAIHRAVCREAGDRPISLTTVRNWIQQGELYTGPG
jgi:hypothetical protein